MQSNTIPMLLGLVTGIYVLLNLAIGFWKLRSTSYEAFLSGKGCFGWGWISASLVGSVVGGGMFFSVVQIAYEAGTVVLFLPIAYLLGYVLLAAAAPRVRERLQQINGLSLYDTAVHRLAGQRAAPAALLALSVVFFCMYFFILAGQFTVLARFYEAMFGVSSATAWALSLGVIGACTLVYTITGGIKKDIASDLFQVLLSFLGLGLIAYYLMNASFAGLHRLPAEMLNGTGYGSGFIIGIFLFFSPSFVARFDYWQRLIACRSTIGAQRALMWSFPPILAAYLVLGALGIYVRSAAPASLATEPTVWGLQSIMPEAAFLVAALALYAAVMSAADTMINVCTVSLHSIIRTVFPRHRHEGLGLLRLLSLAVGIGASFVVLTAPNIVDLFVGAFSSIVIASPAIAMLIFAKRPRAAALLSSILLGYGSFLILFLGMPELRKSAFVAGALVALAALGVASWRTGTTENQQLEAIQKMGLSKE